MCYIHTRITIRKAAEAAAGPLLDPCLIQAKTECLVYDHHMTNMRGAVELQAARCPHLKGSILSDALDHSIS